MHTTLIGGQGGVLHPFDYGGTQWVGIEVVGVCPCNGGGTHWALGMHCAHLMAGGHSGLVFVAVGTAPNGWEGRDWASHPHNGGGMWWARVVPMQWREDAVSGCCGGVTPVQWQGNAVGTYCTHLMVGRPGSGRHVCWDVVGVVPDGWWWAHVATGV